MRVFLTGGTGFIGQPLTQALLDRDWQVTALVRTPDGAPARRLVQLGATLHKGDITDRESMRAGMRGADLVVHNAAWYEVGLDEDARRRMYNVNVTGTHNVLSLAEATGVPRVVYVSTIAVLGDTGDTRRDETFERESSHASFYEMTKTEAHEIALDYLRGGLPLIIVCPGFVIGPNDHSPWGYFARLYVNHALPPIAWSKTSIHAHVYIDDIAEGIALAAEKGGVGESYLLAGDIATMSDIFSVWATTPGGMKAHLWLPSKALALPFAAAEPLQRALGLPAFISAESVRGSTRDYNFSSDKAKRELGWNPRSYRETWLQTLAAERELKDRRGRTDLRGRLRPLDSID